MRARLAVDLLVRAQVALLGEVFSAGCAAVGFLSGVNALVHLQVTEAIETLPAERTDEPLLMHRFSAVLRC